MPCTSENNRQQDKYTAWQNAHADQLASLIAVAAAEVAVGVACPWFWTGIGTAACAAALAALATALGVQAGAIYKTSNAMQAYHQAYAAYQDCLAKCKTS